MNGNAHWKRIDPHELTTTIGPQAVTRAERTGHVPNCCVCSGLDTANPCCQAVPPALYSPPDREIAHTWKASTTMARLLAMISAHRHDPPSVSGNRPTRRRRRASSDHLLVVSAK